jgi:nickel/cobalt exporter
MNRRVTLFLLAASLFFMQTPVFAHVVLEGFGSQTIINIRNGKVYIDYDLSYSQVAGVLKAREIDKDGDAAFTASEIEAFTNELFKEIASNISLSFDGKKIPLKLVKAHDVSLKEGQYVPSVITVMFLFEGKIGEIGGQRHSILYKDLAFKGKRSSVQILVLEDFGAQLLALPSAPGTNRKGFLFPGSESDFMLEAEGCFLTFKALPKIPDNVQKEDITDSIPTIAKAGAGQDNSSSILRIVNERNKATGAKSEKKTPQESKLTSNKNTTVSGASQTNQSDSQPGSDAFRDKIVAYLHGSAWAVILGLAIAVLWGAAHAFTPGHGKSMVAAYLIGTKGRVRDAIILGITVTLTHTGSIIITTIILYFAMKGAEVEVKNKITAITAVISGLIVFLMGFGLFWRRWGKKGHSHSHSRGILGHSHPHISGHSHNHNYGHAHEHGHDHEHDHSHAHNHDHNRGETDHDKSGEEKGVSRWNLLLLGIAGGIIPCPAALTIFFIVALFLGDFYLSIMFLLAFSIGLGFVLTGLGTVFILTKSILASTVRENKLLQYVPPFRNRLGEILDRIGFKMIGYIPAASALFIMLLGNFMTVDVLVKMKVFGRSLL